MRTIGIIVVAAAAILGGAFLYNRHGNKTAGQKAAAAAVTNPKGIVLQSISLPEAGFIVIRQDSGNQPGDVLGVSPLLKKGMNQNVQIPAKIGPSQPYFVTAYADTDKGKTFDPSKDMPMKDAKGNVMSQQVTAPAQ